MKALIDACQPYTAPYPARPPAHITGILDRLDTYELRRLAIVLSVVRPAVFEQELLAIWADRK